MQVDLLLGTGEAALCLDRYGRITDIRRQDGESVWPRGLDPQTLLRVCQDKQIYEAEAFVVSEDERCLRYQFGSDRMVELSLEVHEHYTSFRVTSASPEIDHLLVGPIYSTLEGEIGEIVGVVQGDGHALGIQALNPKTLAGFPPGYPTSTHPYVTDFAGSESSVATIEFTESAAYRASFPGEDGSLLQLFVEARDRKRQKDFLNFEDVPLAAWSTDSDALIAGAGFALFSCRDSEILDVIEAIELGEDLPHPTIDGEWTKRSRETMRSYLIADFLPEEFAYLLEQAKAAGMSHLYHAEPYENWGHFDLRQDAFPDGVASLEYYAQQAEAEGMGIGLHSLSTFTTTNDPYVSPVPTKSLMALAETTLAKTLQADDTVIELSDADGFRHLTMLQTIQVGEELIRFSRRDGKQLVDLARGAWETIATTHPAGTTVRLLTDHPYRVFFPDIDLQTAYSAKLASLCAEGRASMLSFDGLEGCMATGEDLLAMNRLVHDFWQDSGRDGLLNDASRLTHFLWHIHTRMNWGEPWGAKMREGMIEHRVTNQAFFKRNLLPRMLGWFLLRTANRKFEATSPEDIEWALSMAAGFDAGFALSTSYTALKNNHCSGEILKLIRKWEALRLGGALDEELRTELRRVDTEWHLTEDSDGYLLYPLTIVGPLVCDLLEQQPGQPGGSDWLVKNPYESGSYDLRIQVNGYGDVHRPSLSSKQGNLIFDCTIKPTQYLWFRQGLAYLTDRNYKFLEDVSYQGDARLASGTQNLSFACDWSGDEGPEIVTRLYLRGMPHRLPYTATDRVASRGTDKETGDG